MRFKLTVFIYFIIHPCFAQLNNLSGKVTDKNQSPLPYATIALLHPADSTMAYFGITTDDGSFYIKNINIGKYILQCSFIGYKTFYNDIDIPSSSPVQQIQLVPLEQSVNEVNITGERIPVRIKQDTIEYDAGAYKTKPDAVAEDLLKKLPGVEVDRNGNIKAQGEQIQNVLVDGKEFFSNDPKVATKNLPADAIDKVQVYDKKSDQSELTGIDDGEREKTINLMLKDNRKTAIFGDATAAAGTDDHYKLNAKLYRFTKTQQFAFIGMLNDINESGFSFKDYMDFSGGFRNMGDGNGGMQFTFNTNNAPVNFGETENGLISSGAGGLNYTYEPVKNNRINISYMANGTNKKTQDNIYTENYTGEQKFYNREDAYGNSKDRNHTVTLNWRNRPDSTQNIQVNGNLTLSNGSAFRNTHSLSYTDLSNENELVDEGDETDRSMNSKVHASYLKRWNRKWKILKISGDASINSSLNNADWMNISRLFTDNILSVANNFRDNTTGNQNYSAIVSATHDAGHYYFIEPGLETGTVFQSIKREEGIQNAETGNVDFEFITDYRYARPYINFKYNNKKKHFLLALKSEFLDISNTIYDANIYTKNYFYLIPKVSWENEYQSGRRYGINYSARVSPPSSSSLLPVADDRNPLLITFGNPTLKPEYQHNLRFNWNIFDQFSFTSFFTSFYARYTKDKVTWTSVINDDLSQLQAPLNSDDDYLAVLNAEVTTPIRKAGVNISIEGSETFNQGINIINGDENIITSYTHKLSLTFDNRKKEKLDLSIGSSASLTNSNYSLKDNNATYIQLSYFTDISYQPTEKWHVSCSADISTYLSQSFNSEVVVPLIKSEVSRYFLKANRLSLSLQAYDLLNKNTGIERVSEQNYLREKQSLIIGRYVLFAIKYRLNKFDSSGGVKVDVK
ncbi:MAG: outer membrane beta-barrel protein [Bacteroidota bacterium]